MAGKKHVTSACLNCRRRKIKCDGKDECSHCRVSKHTCIYNAEADLRRASAKKAAGKLRARLALLEETLQENNIELPPNHPIVTEKRGSPRNVRSSELDNEVGSGMSEGSTTFADSSQCSRNAGSKEIQVAGGVSESILPNNEHFSMPESVTSTLEPPDMNGHMSPSEAHRLDEHFGVANLELLDMGDTYDEFMLPSISKLDCSQFPGFLPSCESEDNDSDADSDITKFLAARTGSLRIAEDGQLRYYGPTSNLHAYQSDLQSLSQSTIRHVATEGNAVLKRLGLDYDVPPSLEEHLARLYFAWEDPAIHVVDEDTFFQEKQRWTAGERRSPYYSETLNNAVCAIGATLSAGEKLNVPEPAPEFFSARAKALLDIEMDSPTVATVQALVVMSASEASFTRDARGWLYSGYQDTMKNRMWRPYPKPAGQSVIPEAGIFFPLEACTDANITLCEFMRRINLTLYSGQVMSLDRLVRFLKPTKQELLLWHETIEPSLRVNLAQSDIIYVPAILQLHTLNAAYEGPGEDMFDPSLLLDTTGFAVNDLMASMRDNDAQHHLPALSESLRATDNPTIQPEKAIGVNDSPTIKDASRSGEDAEQTSS
ncbi:hypothetical protein G7Z17_g489 [Cylindrodendrum hubeiense]|uniref:Zn(2)-C6 fungal-type domain-containing protein n=1 Tax=Cylindrodendrum hubeiense TaxID=595255 RepID=A0A9P5HPZ0_9HYPO|nr:hypothetical protein G7Z17_g489 [Cylindrodendrum hubeiense]